MEIESDERRNGGKRIYQRMGPASGQNDRVGKVCYHWQAGRCNRHPCPFLHSELSAAQDPSTSFKRGNHNLVWRNPRSGANGGAPNGDHQSKWGKGRHGDDTERLNGGVRASQGVKPCKHFLSGSCPYGDRCRYLHSWSVGDGFSLITPLKGHQKVQVLSSNFPSLDNLFYSLSGAGTNGQLSGKKKILVGYNRNSTAIWV
jgi:CCCH-type zinc finger